MRMKKKFTKQLLWKTLFLVFLIIVFVVDLIYVSFYRGKEKENDKMESSYAESEMITEKLFIVNLHEFVSKSIGDKDVVVEEEVREYCRTIKKDIESAEVFFVTIPEDDNNKIIFFLKLSPTEEIIEVYFDYETEMIIVADSKYTEEEIVNEVWLGDAPAIRDVQ